MLSKDEPIRRFMTRAPVKIDAELTLADARDRMAEEKVRHLPVLDGPRLVGIISARDVLLLESLHSVDPDQTPVTIAMSGDPITCTADTPLAEVLEVMQKDAIGAMPVVDDDGVVGIFTSVDAVRILREALV